MRGKCERKDSKIRDLYKGMESSRRNSLSPFEDNFSFKKMRKILEQFKQLNLSETDIKE